MDSPNGLHAGIGGDDPVRGEDGEVLREAGGDEDAGVGEDLFEMVTLQGLQEPSMGRDVHLELAGPYLDGDLPSHQGGNRCFIFGSLLRQVSRANGKKGASIEQQFHRQFSGHSSSLSDSAGS